MKRPSRKLKSEIVKKFLKGVSIHDIAWVELYRPKMDGSIYTLELIVEGILREYYKNPWPLEKPVPIEKRKMKWAPPYCSQCDRLHHGSCKEGKRK